MDVSITDEKPGEDIEDSIEAILPKNVPKQEISQLIMLQSQSAVITKLFEEVRKKEVANVEIALPEYAKPEIEKLHMKLKAVEKEFQEELAKLGGGR